MGAAVPKGGRTRINKMMDGGKVLYLLGKTFPSGRICTIRT